MALIRLSQPITATEYIQIVCMHPGSPSYDNVQADVAGWGQIRGIDILAKLVKLFMFVIYVVFIDL